MTELSRHSRLSEAAPWIVAGVILLAAGTASYGPFRRGPVPARDRTTIAPRAGSATVGTEPSSHAPTLTPMSDADVAELRRRRLPIPVEGISAAMLVPTFHQARGEGEHQALDILAPRGTGVVAVEDGQVAKLFTSQRGGLTIYLFDAASVYCYYYAHLDQYAEGLREGQNVVRGEVIGYVGTTGNAPANTPHLHFAVFKLGPEKNWWQGTAIDPYLIWR
jgi:peptidoglycan LD-endopeptidase LytH